MPLNRALIGVASEPRTFEVEKGALRYFAKATGETDPIYSDEDAAKKAGHRALPAPPTYLFSMNLGAPAKRGDLFDADGGFGVDLARILHGEQAFSYTRTIYAGDRVTLVTTTRDILEKKGGALELLIQDTVATDKDGELLASMRVTTVVRNG